MKLKELLENNELQKLWKKPEEIKSIGKKEGYSEELFTKYIKSLNKITASTDYTEDEQAFDDLISDIIDTRKWKNFKAITATEIIKRELKMAPELMEILMDEFSIGLEDTRKIKKEIKDKSEKLPDKKLRLK